MFVDMLYSIPTKQLKFLFIKNIHNESILVHNLIRII